MSTSNITITCEDAEYQFAIDDVLPDFLQDAFDLVEQPKILYEAETNLVIPSKRWQSNIKPGCCYYIKKKGSKGKQTEKSDGSMGELVLNSLIASTAVYHLPYDRGGCTATNSDESSEDECSRYLMEQLDNHNFEYIIPSRYGENCYIIAKELYVNRVYIAFRGTKELSDWKYNLQVYRESCGSSLIQGKFHSGFLQRAKLFPIDRIINEEMFKTMDIICCGHSLGGAVASIVSIRLQAEKRRYQLQGTAKCITFGAPFFGDLTLQKSVNAENIYHFVVNNDPVPQLLTYSYSMSSSIHNIDSQINSLVHNFSTAEGASYHKNQKDTLIEKKMKYQEILSRVASIAGPLVGVASLLYPGVGVLANVRNVMDLFGDIKSSISHKQSVYVPIGNFHFLAADDSNYNRFFPCVDDIDCVLHHIEKHSNDICQEAHALTNYTELLHKFKQPQLHFGHYPRYFDSNVGDMVLTEARTVIFKQCFQPVIHQVKLVRVENRDKSMLRLSFTGRYLFDVVLDKCTFHFNFPFANNQEIVTVKKVSMGDKIERLVLEEPYTENISISDFGTSLTLVTQFGTCDQLIRCEDIRELPIPTVTQIARDDSVSLIVRRAIQRGMALSKIRREGGGSSVDRIIKEIRELGHIVLGMEGMKDVEAMFNDNLKDFQFILSHEEAFEKVKAFCHRIENYLLSPMEIHAERSVIQKIGFGLAFAFGAAAAGYIAGPGLVIIGLATGVSGTAVAIGGVAGGVTAGTAANALLKEKLTDSAYENALKFIIQQLYEAREKQLSSEEISNINDLRDDGSIYSNEKVLMLLTDGVDDFDFGGCSLSMCTEGSKEIVQRRIKAVKKIHQIRDIFSKQCFIGLVGLQDAGKTTLLKKIWGFGGNTGFFTHTDVPMLYEINNKLLVVDFPGSNSLDYHSKTFSICGAMNNMVIVVIPFTGDISRVVSDEVDKVFQVMRGSSSTKVFLCINKCGLFLEKLKEELKAHPDPVRFLKKRFLTKLHEHYECTGKGIVVGDDDILFTDWEIGDGDEAKQFGIGGVEVIKNNIRDYLVDYRIYNKEDVEELKQCTSTIHTS